MKITVNQLRRIIKEEVSRALKESPLSGDMTVQVDLDASPEKALAVSRRAQGEPYNLVADLDVRGAFGPVLTLTGAPSSLVRFLNKIGFEDVETERDLETYAV